MKASVISLLLFLGVAVAEENAPWALHVDPVCDALAGAIATGQPAPFQPEAGDGSSGSQMALLSLPDASCLVDDPSSPEIQELARGLEYSPWRIYEYCKNRIRHEAYWGCKKGAILTLLEESGNSFDTSALMVALLKAAGCTNVEYRYGPAVVSADDLDDWLGLLRPNSGDGIAYPNLSDAQFRTKFSIASGTSITSALRFQALRISYLLGQGYPGAEPGNSSGPEIYYVPHVWVRFKDQGGTSHELDPSFKFVARRMETLIRPGGSAYGYDLATFRTASGPANPPDKSVLQLKEGQMADKLDEYSTNLLGWLNTNYPGASTEDFLYQGLPSKVLGDLASNELTSGIDYTSRPWLATTTWSSIPDQWKTKVTFSFGTGAYDPVTRKLSSEIGRKELFTACLAGEKLSFHVSGANSDALEFHWGETSLFGSSSIPISGATYDVAVAVTHPFGTYSGSGVFTDSSLSTRQQHEVKTYARSNANAYVYAYGFDASARHLRRSQERLDAYRAASVADSDWRVRTEILNVMGLSYLQQKRLSDKMVATHARVLPVSLHAFARMGQQNAYFIDFGLSLSGSQSYSGDEAVAQNAFNTGTFFASALEHAMIEQLQTTPTATAVTAISTAKVFHLANQQVKTFYWADNSNWSSVRTTLASGGWPTAALDSIAAQITGSANAAAGAQVLLPERGDIGTATPVPANEWRGYGYSLLRNNQSVMAISGGYAAGQYSGGYASENGTVASDPVTTDYSAQPGYYSFAAFLGSGGQDPVTTPRMFAADPVDMATGAFAFESTDLSCGGAMPRGLVFHRSYNSGRCRDREAGLGYGWTHNLDIYATRRSATRSGLGDAGTPGQMTPMYVATAAAMDVFANRTATGKLARDWAIPVLVAQWGVDELLKNGVSITMGNRAIEFVKVPNTSAGVFVPPAGITSTLTESGTGKFTLSERHGNSYVFLASGTKKKLDQIVDQFGKTAQFTYNGLGKLSKVTDCYSRVLTLTWNGNRITKVEETAGSLIRDVDFSYINSTTTTADDDTLNTVTDPEGRVFTNLYDTGKRIYAIKDGRNRIITENVYDSLGRVKQQKLHGDSAKTFNLFLAGDRNIEQNPAGAKTTYLYDRLGRATGVIDATGNESFTGYDGQNQIVTEASPSNNGVGAGYRPVKKTFDANRNLTQIELPPRSSTDPHGPYTAARLYDPQLRLWKVYDFKGNFTEYTYTAKHQVYTIRDRKGVVITTNSYDGEGKLQSVTDAANKTTSYLDYDAYGNARKIEYPAVEVNGVTVVPYETFVYSARGDLLSHTDRNGNTTGYTYNEARQPRVTTLPALDGVAHTLEIQYDQAGTAWRSKDARGNWVQTDTSQTGKLLSITFPATAAGIAVSENHYDAQDRLDWSTDPLSQRTVPGYDAAGRIQSITDPLQRTSLTFYDADGLVKETRDPRGKSNYLRRDFHGEVYETENALTQLSSSAPDANGNQDTLTNKRGKVFDFGYDANDRLVSLKTPLLKETTRDWTSRGLPDFVEEPSNDRAEFLQDDQGRQRQELYKHEGSVVATVTRHLDKQGNLKKIEETIAGVTKSVEFPDYDTRNRLRSFTDVRGKTIGYRHDANGNLIELIYPDGRGSVSYTWDAMNRLTKVIDWAGRETEYFYDLAGRLKRVERHNGTERRLLWDAAGQLKLTIELAANGQSLWYIRNRHDAAGRRDQEEVFPSPHAFTSPSFSATFDDDNRLATFNGTSVVHDSDGNMTTGPLGANPSAAFNYDSRNRLVSAGGQSYGYDPLGNRVSVTAGTAETKWTIDPAGSLSRALVREKPDGSKTWYVYGLGLLYEVNQAGSNPDTTASYHFDSRGSTVALTADDGQTVLDRVEYDSWGAETWRQAAFDTPFRYHGAYGVQSDTNGLCQMRARFYSPQIRRFLNADPSGFGGGSNWYQFAGGNPLAFADPLGLEPMMNCIAGPPPGPWNADSYGLREVVLGGLAMVVGGGAELMHMPFEWLASNGMDPLALGPAGGAELGLFEALGEAGAALKMASLARGAEELEEGSTLFRGTTAGYAGNPCLQEIGITPATTDPAIATIFATESANYGEGVVHIASPQALRGVAIGEGNVLATMEREVAVELLPAEFAARSQTITVAQSRAILEGLGVRTPAMIADKAALDAAIRSTPAMTAEQILSYLNAVGP